MSNRSILKTMVALGATVLMVSVGLSLGAGAANASTTTASVTASVWTQINTNRETQPGVAFLRNGFVDEYADDVSSAEVAAKGAPATLVPAPNNILQPGFGDVGNYTYVATGSLSSSTAARIAAAFETATDFGDFYTDNYAGLTITASKGKIYAEIVVAQYDSPPLDRIIASTPTIAGDAVVGSILTARQTVTTPGTSTAFAWYADNETNSGDALATGATYFPAPDAFGDTITVIATTTENGYVDSVVSSVATKGLGEGNFDGTTLTVVGSRHVGQVLDAEPGNFGPVEPNLSFAWFVNGKLVSDASSSYEIGIGDKGYTINARMTESATNFKTRVITSTSKTTVADPFIPTTAVPVVQGESIVGQTLTASDGGDWGPGTVKETWQWSVGGKKVSGATKKTFVIPTSAYTVAGLAVTVTETGTESHYAATSVTSQPTDTVDGLYFSPEGSISFTGTAAPGHTIKAVIPTFTPKATKTTYKWLVDDVIKSTSSSYKIPANASTETITLIITATRAGYYTFSAGDDDIEVTGAP